MKITLSQRAQKYFNKVKYELDDGDGCAISNSRAINDSLEAVAIFEYCTNDHLLGWLMENYPTAFNSEGQFIHDDKI